MDENNDSEIKFEQMPGAGAEKEAAERAEKWQESMADAPEFGGEEILGGTGELTGDNAKLVTAAEKDEYRRVTAGAENWLGTGRYAQGKNGERIDVLERIFRGGGNGADGDETEPGTLKSTFVTNREEAMTEADGENGGADGSFNTGSSIAGDYPILLGAKNAEGGQPLANLPWEQVRAEGGVNLDNFTHIEVPKEHIRETRALLEKYGVALPVVAIGVGTAVAIEQARKAEEEGLSDEEYEERLEEATDEAKAEETGGGEMAGEQA